MYICVRVCEYVNIASPLLDPTSCISRGSVLVSPGDSQSVLALQYKKDNCNIQETSSPVGLSILQSPCVGQLNLNTCCVLKREREFVCMFIVTVTHYIFIWKQMCD